MRIAITIAAVLLTSCLGPMEMPDTMIDNSHTCIQWIAQAEIAKANSNPPIVGDPTQALLALAIEKLGEQNAPDPYQPCYKGIEAFTQAYIATVQANASMINKALGVAVIPASIMAGGWAQSEILQGAGGVAIDAVSSDVFIDSGGQTDGGAGRLGVDNPNIIENNNQDQSSDDSVDTDIDIDNSVSDSGNTEVVPDP